MSKRTMIAGLVLCAGAPVMAQVNEVDPNSDAQVIRQSAKARPQERKAPTNPIDLGGVVYHGSARVITTVGTLRANQVFTFDDTGVMTGQYDQVAGAIDDAWGYRDGTSDGTSIYFGWGGGLAKHDLDGSNGVVMIQGAAPGGVGTWRALAHDPTGDGGRGSFWTASFGSVLIETTMQGALIQSFPPDGWSLYGLSYDPTDGNLWAHHTGGEVFKIDTATGLVMLDANFIPNPGWFTGFPNLAAQGGLSGAEELGGNIAAASQGVPDEFGVYDVAAGDGSLAFGPIDMEGQTGTNGHLGIAVVPAGSACPCACNFDTSTGNNVCDLFDFLAFQGGFVAGDPCMCDIDTSTGGGVCDLFDFLAFQGAFVQGCP